MKGVSTPYELTGRTSQKARTRNALLSAARELLAEGLYPTVEQAADRAQVSRTNAYRYFKNRRALLLATYPELEAPSLLDEHAPADPVARLEAAVEHFLSQTLENEPELRAQWRLALEPESDPAERPLRTGRAIAWFEDALAPLRDELDAAELRRLVLAIRAGCGIEALVWLTDVAGLTREQAVENMAWAARTLVQSVIDHR